MAVLVTSMKLLVQEVLHDYMMLRMCKELNMCILS